MKPATGRIKAALADLGIPRSAVRAVTNGAVTYATACTDAGRRLLDEQAERLVGPRYGAIIRRHGCGCVVVAIVTTDPRHAGQVDRLTYPPGTIHQCDNHEGDR